MPREVKGAIKSRSLVAKLIVNPQLPAYIPTLETPVLGRLIEYVGKEDAQELMLYATQEQIQELIEMEVFRNDKPGKEENFDAARFLEWLSLWDDMGPAFLAEKVRGLGSELFALALDEYVVVVDLEEVGVSGDVNTFANFAVMPRDEEDWPEVYRLLAEVWDEDADLIEEVLAHCCQRRSLLTERTHITGNDTLHRDVAGDREQRRQERGYVTPTSASLFLGDARASKIDELLIEVGYDRLTSIHLNVQARSRRDANGSVEAENREPAVTTSEETLQVRRAWQQLDQLLVEARVLEQTPADRLLAAPEEGHRKTELFLKRALRELGKTNPAAQAARLNEVVYLANVLVAGTAVQGGVFTESEAANAVYALCNLGLTYCFLEDPFDDEARMLASFLEAEPGLIKAFRIGYHLSTQLPHKALVAIVRALTAPQGQRTLRRNPWIQEQIARDFNFGNFEAGLDNDRIDSLKALIDTLALVFDSNTCEQLRIICDPLPCFPKSLEMNAPPQIRVNREKRYLCEPSDIRRLLAFLEELGSRLVD